MNDHRGLIDKLTKLAGADASFKEGWRRVGGARDLDQLAPILREIDETQLPRALRFRNENGQILHVEAGNRRLRQIVSVSWSDQSAFKDILQKELSNPTVAEIEAIGRVFRTFQPGDQTTWVQNEGLSEGSEGSQTGLPAAKLARALSIDLDTYSDENLQHRFEAFANAQTSLSDAWARFENGALVEESTPKPDAAWRDSWKSADFTHLQNGSGPIENVPTLCMFGSGIKRDRHQLVATCGATYIVLIVSSADVAEIAQNWRDLGL